MLKIYFFYGRTFYSSFDHRPAPQGRADLHILPFYSKIAHTYSMHQKVGLQPKLSVFISFVVIFFLISFADAIMSYISPVFIESQVNDLTLMGIIFSFSSVVGIICDMVFPKIFSQKQHFFYLKVTVLSAILFPGTLLFFPQHVMTLIFAMAIWGLYFELNMFSSFQFVHKYVHVQEHTRAWGILQAFQSAAYGIAPPIAAFLIKDMFEPGFYAVFAFLGIAVFLTIFFKVAFVNTQAHHIYREKPTKSWAAEFRIWKVLAQRVWPLLVLQIAVYTIDASFWTIGALLMEDLSHQHSLGAFLLSAYIVPAAVVSLFLGSLPFPFGKKKTALISSILAGAFLALYAITPSVPMLLIITMIISVLLGIAVPEIKATFEDYVSRLKNDDSEMIGLQGSSSSLAYVIGPILGTFLASIVGIPVSFSILGLLLFCISIFLLFVTPKKIMMPQEALADLD